MGDDGLAGQALSMRGLALLAGGDVAGARVSVLEGAAANHRGGQPNSMAYSLEALAAVAMADRRPALAARALAAAAAGRGQFATPLAPAIPPLVTRLTNQAREQLGDASFDAASSLGRGWTLLEALDRTLEDLEAIAGNREDPLTGSQGDRPG